MYSNVNKLVRVNVGTLKNTSVANVNKNQFHAKTSLVFVHIRFIVYCYTVCSMCIFIRVFEVTYELVLNLI